MILVDDLKDPMYGREPTDSEVRAFYKEYPNERGRRYDPWCPSRGINEAIMREKVSELKSKMRIDKMHGRNSRNPDSRTFSKSQIIGKMELQGKKCNGCGCWLREDDVCGDHIIPYSRGGVTELWNLQALCTSCNQSKKAKDPLIWARDMGVELPKEFIDKYYEGVVDSSTKPRYWKF